MLLRSISELQAKYLETIVKTNSDNNCVSTRGVCDGIYDWFPMVQRFTRSFLRDIFQMKEVVNSKMVLEPFMGSGNTLVACREHDKIGFGVDISPFFWFISHVKTSEYTTEDFQGAIEELRGINEKAETKAPELSSFRDLFTKSQLAKLLRLRDAAGNLDQKTSELLLFAMVSELLNFSKAERYGKGLRKKKGKSINVEARIRHTLLRMEKDYQDFKNSDKNSKVIPLVGDSRNISMLFDPITKKAVQLPKGQFDNVITSPPYCNSADYIEMYKLEHWFLNYVSSYDQFRELSKATIRSHTSFDNAKIGWVNSVVEDISVHLEEEKKLWNKKIPTMIRGYFDDMHTVLGQVKKYLRRNGSVILLVANSSYAEIPIPTDLLLAEAAVDQGFKVTSIKNVRRLTTSGQQWKRMDSESREFIRESLLTLQK